jgi:hypothetical protein
MRERRRCRRGGRRRTHVDDRIDRADLGAHDHDAHVGAGVHDRTRHDGGDDR